MRSDGEGGAVRSDGEGGAVDIITDHQEGRSVRFGAMVVERKPSRHSLTYLA